MIERLILTVAGALLLFVVTGLFLPRTVHVERSIEIERPPGTVFTLVNSFESFPAWSPWSERDPGVRYEISGPVSGVGARLAWSGDERLVGEGWQQIVYSEPDRLVRTHIELDRQGAAEMYVSIDRVDGGVRVTWGFDTDLVEGHGFFGSILSRWFGLFFDRWIGGDQEAGLARLKNFAESLPAGDFSGAGIEVVDVEPMEILYITVEDGPDTAGGLAQAFRQLTAFMAARDLPLSAQPMAITRSWDRQGYRFDAAIPVGSGDIEVEEPVRIGLSPSGRAVRLVHTGPYDRMGPSYEKLAAYMAVHGLKEGRVSWEHYISDPGVTPQNEIVTHIYFLVDEAL